MIKEVILNYPLFKLNINKKFKSGINIVEESNWFWKTTILNTIMSIYTNKFPWLKTLPEWTATVIMDNNKYLLSKWKWIWVSHEFNDIYKYCVPWKFFEWLSTTQQRNILIELLDLNFDKYMKNECKKIWLTWSEDLEKKLKSELKYNTDISNLLSEDIMRLKSQLINFDNKDFSDVNKFYENKEIINNKVIEYNNSVYDRKIKYDKLCNDIDNHINSLNNINEYILDKNNAIKHLEKELLSLKDNYSKASIKALCNQCWNEITWNTKIKIINWILNKISEVKKNISKYKQDIKNANLKRDEIVNELNILNQEKYSYNTDFNILNQNNILENSKLFWIDFDLISESRIKEYEDYKVLLAWQAQIKNELSYKENKLREIDIIKLSNDIDKLIDLKSKFTIKLQKAVKDLDLDIKLFETLKNWNVRETFTINYNNTDYYDLSLANKLIVNVMLSKIFIDKLWLDFILIDEASIISKDNLEYIKQLWKNYQVILFKATWWNEKDLT